MEGRGDRPPERGEMCDSNLMTLVCLARGGLTWLERVWDPERRGREKRKKENQGANTRLV